MKTNESTAESNSAPKNHLNSRQNIAIIYFKNMKTSFNKTVTKCKSKE